MMEETDAESLATDIIENWFETAEQDGFDYEHVATENNDAHIIIIHTPGWQRFRMVVEKGENRGGSEG